MANLVTGYEVSPERIRVWADIPRRRNGEHNEAAMARALLKLGEINPDTFDPPEVPKPEPVRFEGVVIDETTARVALRDGVVLPWVGGTGQLYASKMDAVANGEQIVNLVDAPACRTGACDE